MSQNRLHFYGYLSTGQFAQHLLADSDVPTMACVRPVSDSVNRNVTTGISYEDRRGCVYV